jgi:hypothetical protein
VRNSSVLNWSLLAFSGVTPNKRKKLFETMLVSHTSGYNTFSNGYSTKLAGKAMRSGYKAPSILGIISAKIMVTSVMAKVAMAAPVLPYRRCTTMAAMAAVAALARLLPINTMPKKTIGARQQKIDQLCRAMIFF